MQPIYTVRETIGAAIVAGSITLAIGTTIGWALHDGVTNSTPKPTTLGAQYFIINHKWIDHKPYYLTNEFDYPVLEGTNLQMKVSHYIDTFLIGITNTEGKVVFGLPISSNLWQTYTQSLVIKSTLTEVSDAEVKQLQEEYIKTQQQK